MFIPPLGAVSGLCVGLAASLWRADVARLAAGAIRACIRTPFTAWSLLDTRLFPRR